MRAAYLRVRELAALIGVSPDRIYARIAAGELPSVREGRVRLVPVSAAVRLWPELSPLLESVVEERTAGRRGPAAARKEVPA
jgi:excisionase family DNA binding protein